MLSDFYPDPVKVPSKLSKYEGRIIADTQSQSGDFAYIYVGVDKDISSLFTSIFHAGFMTSSINEVQHVFKESQRNNLPQVICIDVVLDKKALALFHNFLLRRKLSSKLVVIYNESKLSQPNIDFLKEYELVDDVINLNTTPENLRRRIDFLRKVKSSMGSQKNALAKSRNSFGRQNKNIHLKRSFDIVFALLSLIVLSPVFLLIALATMIDSRGPIVYSSLRAGRGFKIFKFYKFRTMVIDADKKIQEYAHLNQYAQAGEGNPMFVKIANDPRITRFGKILRNCSLDELPQLINVLKGDMSLVGNRPLPLYEASTLTTNDHVERFMAPAGITGLWQIKKRGRTEMSTEERINLDISYARQYSMAYDLWIVAKTPAALFQKSNA
jgi:lipopolysaccharide/colanic/teichoic acid biosynthesis glycosyltransferase